MVGVVAGVIGLALGVAVMWGLSMKRSQSLRDEVTRAESALAVRDSQLTAANDLLERERVDHATAIENMERTFENLSNRVLLQTVQQFSQSQEDLVKLRESKLDSTLKPLETLLGEYKKNLADFNTQNAGALSDVKGKAEELLEAQKRAQEETRRLNQLLGRSDQRGRWGEIQLANVLEMSGLRQEHRLRPAGDERQRLRSRTAPGLRGAHAQRHEHRGRREVPLRRVRVGTRHRGRRGAKRALRGARQRPSRSREEAQ